MLSIWFSSEIKAEKKLVFWMEELIGHPRNKVERKYYVYTKEKLSKEDILKIKKGIFLSPSEKVKADIKHIDYVKGKHKWRVILKEGKNREIRRIFLRYKLKVYNLHRYAFAGLTLRGIDKGHYKKVTFKEISSRFK